MATIEVDAKGFFAKFAELEGKRPEAVRRGIASAIQASAEVVAKVAPMDLGSLRRSVRGTFRGKGGYVIVDAPYSGGLEVGTRPHFVPYSVLLPWCIRHSSEAEGPSFAKRLQRKIAREGTRPTYFMRKTLPTQRRILKAEVERALGAVR